MTMVIKGVQIAGLPAVTVRNLIRASNLTKEYVAKTRGLSIRNAKRLIDQLVGEGFIKPMERSPFYELTAKGHKLAAAPAVSKLPRAKAERIIADLMKRVDEINAADYMYRVPTVIVYGSYVRGEERLSDVDIAVSLEAKWDRSRVREPWEDNKWEEWRQRRLQLARDKGRVFRLFEDGLGWPSREVWLHLKARTQGLSLHPLDDFVDMKKDENFAYKVLLGDAANIAEQLSASAREVASETQTA